jgi:hypothetical protein
MATVARRPSNFRYCIDTDVVNYSYAGINPAATKIGNFYDNPTLSAYGVTPSVKAFVRIFIHLLILDLHHALTEPDQRF